MNSRLSGVTSMFKAAAVALVMMVAPQAASALTIVNIGPIANGGTFNGGDVNIASDPGGFAWDNGFVTGSGTFRVNTFVTPLFPAAGGQANLLIGFGGGATAVTGSWGGVPIVFGFLNGTWSAQFTTSFVTAGLAGAKELIIQWTGASEDQLSVNVQAVPGPIVGAGIPGLVIACASLIFLARRRRRQVAI